MVVKANIVKNQTIGVDLNQKAGGFDAPVQSVNNKTGNVILDASDVGAVSEEQGVVLEGLIDELDANKLDESNISNDLTTPVANKVLSANQGVVLKGLIDALQEEVDTEIPTKVSQLENDSEYIKESSVINNLTTDAINEPLSAKQGKVLKGLIDDITVPTKTSELTNDSGFLTAIPDGYVTETELSNKGYLTEVPSEYATYDALNNRGYMTEAKLNLGLYPIVKTVNNVEPDANGNVDVVGGDGTIDYKPTWNDLALGNTVLVCILHCHT